MMKNVMKNMILKKSIKGIEKDIINLTFVIWKDNTVYCFADIDDLDAMYWYETRLITDINATPYKRINQLIKSYTTEKIKEIEKYVITDYTYIDEYDINVIPKGIYR